MNEQTEENKISLANEIDGIIVEVCVTNGELALFVGGELVRNTLYPLPSRIKIALWARRIIPSILKQYADTYPDDAIYAVPQEWDGGTPDGVNREQALVRLGFKNMGFKAHVLINGMWTEISKLTFKKGY